MEIWKDIKGYEGSYQVSNLGRVKSLKYQKNRILKTILHNNNYYFVTLCNKDNCKNYSVHRLVAQAFIPNPNNYPVVNHKDEDKSNNKADNLEWCTIEYNNNYGNHNKRVAVSNHIPILQFSKEDYLIKRWNSITEAAKELGINITNINNCLRHRSKTSAGYIWGYEKDYEKIPFKVFDLEIYRKKVA